MRVHYVAAANTSQLSVRQKCSL